MKFLPTDQQNLNEIIFANKNKSYGAYAIRASYNNSLLKALTIISSLLLLATGSMYVFNKGQDLIDKKMLDLPDNPVTKIVEVTIQPDKPKAVDPPKANPPSGPKNNALGTVVTDSVADNNTKPTTNVTLQTTGTSTADVSDPSLNTSTLSGTGTNTVTNTATTSSEPYVWLKEMPEFDGGMNALLRFVGANIVYPANAREAGIEGIVHVSFVVDEEGKVGSVKVEKGIGAGCDEESVRVVSKIPKFKKPGMNDGRAVKVRYTIPIKYKLGH